MCDQTYRQWKWKFDFVLAQQHNPWSMLPYWAWSGRAEVDEWSSPGLNPSSKRQGSRPVKWTWNRSRQSLLCDKLRRDGHSQIGGAEVNGNNLQNPYWAVHFSNVCKFTYWQGEIDLHATSIDSLLLGILQLHIGTELVPVDVPIRWSVNLHE